MQKKSDKFKHRKECKAGYKKRQQYRKLIDAIDNIDWTIYSKSFTEWFKDDLVSMSKFKIDPISKLITDKPYIPEPQTIMLKCEIDLPSTGMLVGTEK